MSNIDPTGGGTYSSIYPTANINQSSQGFRNNFASIQSNFGIAELEITNLQNKQLVLVGDVVVVGSAPIFGDDGNPVSYPTQLAPNLVFTGEQGITVPSGTTAERAPTPNLGQIRYNTDTSNIEFYTGSGWVGLGGASNYLPLSGGTMTGNIVLASGVLVGGRNPSQDGAIIDAINSSSFGFVVHNNVNSFTEKTFASQEGGIEITNSSGVSSGNVYFDLDIPGLPNKTNVNAGDLIAIYDSALDTHNSITTADLFAGIGGVGGTVTEVNTGTGLTGGPITTSGTVSLADTAVTPGTYASADVTVDQQGRITDISPGILSSFQLTVLQPTDNITIPQNYQMLLWGDLTIQSGGVLYMIGDLVIL